MGSAAPFQHEQGWLNDAAVARQLGQAVAGQHQAPRNPF